MKSTGFKTDGKVTVPDNPSVGGDLSQLIWCLGALPAVILICKVQWERLIGQEEGPPKSFFKDPGEK